MPSNNYMAEYMRNYREKNKEYYEKEKVRYNEKYKNDPDYREKKIKSALNRYNKKKQETIISKDDD
jgi:hypothetical protein